MATPEITFAEQVIEAWAQQWSSHDVDAVVALHAADARIEDVPRGMLVRGHDQLRAYANDFFGGYPDVVFELTSRFAMDTCGTAEWVMRGTHLGARSGR